MKIKPSKALTLILLCTVYLVACGQVDGYSIPKQTGDGWETAGLDEVGIDASTLIPVIDRIENGTYQNVHSILIIKEDMLVFEEYFGGYAWGYSGESFQGEWVDFDRDSLHNLASVTKSFTSATVGIAMDKGLLSSVDQKAFTFFPQYAHLGDGVKEDITLEHLLTMTSGLEWNEGELPYSDRNNDLVQLFWVPDPIEYILRKPLASEPGTDWYYNGGNTNLLGEVIREVSGRRMDAFAADFLFAPLGINDYEWDFINPDMIHASGNLRLRPRDLAKFGALFMNGGVWQGERIISEDWVEASTQEHVSLQQDVGYGYQWWLNTYRWERQSADAFLAAGWGGQYIIVFPSLEMVVVFTGGNYVDEVPVEEILVEYILPAVN